MTTTQAQPVADVWLNTAKKLATDYAHCYSFVGDESMPIAKKALFDHLDAVTAPQPVIAPAFTKDDSDQLLTERDEYHDVADELADQIALITGADIGEHSSNNCPWQSALTASHEFLAQPAKPDINKELLRKAQEVGYYMGESYGGEPKAVIKRLIATLAAAEGAYVEAVRLHNLTLDELRVSESENFQADAHKLALALEMLLMSTTDDDMVSKIQALQQLGRQQMAKQGKAEICDPLIDIEAKIKPLTWPEVLNAADQYVRSKPTFSKYIEGTLLENDVPVWIADFYMKGKP